jgi:hypothetical protein
MAQESTLQKITDKARKIRKKNEPWISAVKRASKLVMSSLSPSKKAAVKKRRKVGTVKKKASSRQTGSSNTALDKLVKAKPPGKRKSASKKIYYERRRNRSDRPGKMTGVKPQKVQSSYNYMLLSRMKSNVATIEQTTNTIAHLTRKMKEVKDKRTKMLFRQQIQREKNFLSGLKKDNTMLKRLIA